MFHVKHSKTFFPIRILSKPNSIPIYFLSTISYLLSLYRPKYILKSLKNHLKSLTPPLHPLTPLFTPHYFNGSLVGNPAFLGYFFETGFTFSIITRDLAAQISQRISAFRPKFQLPSLPDSAPHLSRLIYME